MRSGRAVVIGGGLAGLAAGYRLSSGGWDVLVLEKEGEIGGRCRTATEEGFLMDTGAQHFRDSYDTTLKTAIEMGLGDAFRIPPVEKGLFYGGRVSPFVSRSMRPSSLLPWRALGLKGLVDFPAVAVPLLRSYRSYSVRTPYWWKNGDESTAEEYLAGRVSPNCRRAIAEPVAVYATGAGLDRLSAAAFMVAVRCTFCDRTGSFRGGIGTLPQALAHRLRVIENMEALEVVMDRRTAVGVRARPTRGGRARSYHADLVVCAVPAPLVEGIAGKLGRVARGVARQSSYTPEVVVNLGFHGEVGGRAGPVLLSRADGFHAAWICTHVSKTLENAPPGASLVTLVYSGEEASALLGEADGKVVELALGEAGRALDLGGLAAGPSRVGRHAVGRPVVSPGHARRVRDLSRAGSGIKNLVLAGDWTSSPTIEGAIWSGFQAAGQAVLRR